MSKHAVLSLPSRAFARDVSRGLLVVGFIASAGGAYLLANGDALAGALCVSIGGLVVAASVALSILVSIERLIAQSVPEPPEAREP